jgi:hypothetical protein
MTAISQQLLYRWRWPIVVGWLVLWVCVIWTLRQAFGVVPPWLRMTQGIVFAGGLVVLYEWLWSARGSADDGLQRAPLPVRVLARWAFLVVLLGVVFNSGSFFEGGAAAATLLLILLVAATYLAQLALTGWAQARYGNAEKPAAVSAKER